MGFAGYLENPSGKIQPVDESGAPLFETAFADVAEYCGRALAEYRKGWRIVVFEEEVVEDRDTPREENDTWPYTVKKTLRWRFVWAEAIAGGVRKSAYSPNTGEEY